MASTQTQTQSQIETKHQSSKARQVQSCLACRQIKVRCLGNEDRDGKCDRCNRLGFDCQYSSKRRGRKTNAERALRDSMSTENTFFPQPGPSRLVDGSLPAPVTSAGHGNINAVDTQFPAINGMPRTSPLASSQAASSSTQTQPQGLPFQSGFAMTMAHIQPLRQDQPQSQPQNQSQPHQSTNTVPAPQTAIQGIPSTHTNPTPTSTGPPRLDVSEYLDPPLPPPAHSPSTRHQHPEPTTELSDDQIGKSFGNPINIGVISHFEAKHLVDLYHKNLNPILALLDPELHTIEFLNETSSALLTAVLVAASKFFRPDIYHQLLSHVQTLLNRAIGAGACDIGIIQCLLILVTFKAPTDRSAWIKIGMAIRLAYQHGWHVPLHRVLPDDPREARLVLNPERTWFCLLCFDRKYARSFGLPTMIRPHEIGDPEAWAREHLHLNIPTDMHIACSIEVTTIWIHFERLARAHELDKTFLKVLLADLGLEHERKSYKWFGPGGSQQYLSDMSKQTLKFLVLDSSLAIKRRRMEWNIELEGGAVKECLSVISQIVDQVDSLANTGVLNFMHDVTAATLSEVTMLLYKLFWRLTSNERSLAISLIKRIHAACMLAANGNEQAATAFIARFTRRTLRALSSESRPASPAPAQEAGQTADEPDFLADLDNFLRSADMFPEATQVDDQYWLSLFAPATAISGDLTIPGLGPI